MANGKYLKIFILIGKLNFNQRAPCEKNFHAIEQAMQYSKACDITSIVAVACAQHGCFVPNSIVNLYHGEGQKNVDF